MKSKKKKKYNQLDTEIKDKKINKSLFYIKKKNNRE